MLAADVEIAWVAGSKGSDPPLLLFPLSSLYLVSLTPYTTAKRTRERRMRNGISLLSVPLLPGLAGGGGI